MKKRWLIVLAETAALAVLTVWIGRGALRNPFHFDDFLFLQSSRVAEPGDPLYLLRPGQSRQLTYLTFYWSYRLGGNNPFGYHLVNLLLHMANALGVYFFAALLLERQPDAPTVRLWPWIPMAAGALFAVHPIQSEAVNYAYQRSTLLAAFFSLLSLNACLLFARSRRPSLPLTIATVAFFLAVVSKESALILPLIWAAYLWSHGDGLRSFRKALAHSWRATALLAAAVILSLVWVLLSFWRSGERTAGLSFARESLRYFLSETQVLATYLRMLVLPTGLSVDHDFRAAPFLSLYSFLCIALLAGMLVGLARLRRASPTAAFLGLSFFVLLSPTSSVVPTADLLFEHRLYLPLIPASVLIAWSGVTLLISWLGSRAMRQAVWIACLVSVVVACSSLFRERTWVWGDNPRLWNDAISKAPWNARAHYNLGVSLLGSNRERSRQAFLQAVQLKPGYAAALYNLGWLEQEAGRLETATEYYRQALAADPGHWQAHHNLGNVYALRGSLRDAIQEYQETTRIQPDYWPAYQSLAALQVQVGKAQEALSTIRTLTALKPDSLEARYLRAYVLVTEGNLAEAEPELRFVAERDRDGAYRERMLELRLLMQRR